MNISLFQTPAWAALKAKSGWRARQVGRISVLTKPLGWGKSFEYAPEVPFTKEVLADVRSILVTNETGVIFTRIEFLEEWSDSAAAELKAMGLEKSFEEVQPEFRQWIDLSLDEETLLGQMKPKGRYNIGVAKRQNLTVEFSTEEAALQEFFELYRQTSARSDFQGRGYKYFQDLLAILKQEQAGEVLVIRNQSGPLAAGIFSYWGGIGSYLYGASGGDRSLMAPYLMHWLAIQRSKAKNCQVYDLLAVAPPDQPNHPYANLTRFKSQFGGRTVRLLGSWDFIRSAFWGTIYQFLERRRRKVLR